MLLDRERMALLTVTPPRGARTIEAVDAKLKARIAVTAGPHELGVTFLKNPSSLLETKRQPYQAHFNFHRHPRISPALYQVSITGPYAAKGAGDTPSRRRIFVCDADGAGRRGRLRPAHPVHPDAQGLSAARHRRRPRKADGVLSARRVRRGTSTRGSRWP